MSYIPPLQVLWLVVYWAGLVPIFTLLGYAFLGGGPLQSRAALVLALTAHVVGAIWATRLARAHIDSTSWVKATTTIRVLAVAWLGIIGYILFAVFASSFLFLELDTSGEALGFVSTVGSVSLLAMIGPGYAEYREARKQRATSPTPEPTPVP